MRKLFSISIAALYLLVSVGVIVNAHFCHNELTDIAFFKAADPCCCDGGEDQRVPAKCCESRTFVLGTEELGPVIPKTIIGDEDLTPETASGSNPFILKLPIPIPDQSFLVKKNQPELVKDRNILFHQFIFYG